MSATIVEPAAPAPAEPDDFTTIPGIGQGVARSLAAQGITTFEQLRSAGELTLTKKALAAIQAWRDGG